MKIPLALLVLSISLHAQNVAVSFYPAGVGPTNLWIEIDYQSSTNVKAGQVLFTDSTWQNYMTTNQASWLAWQTNGTNPAIVIQQDLSVLQSRLATNNLDRLNMQTNTLSNSNLNQVVFNILRTLHKLENLFQDQYFRNPQDSGQ